MLQGELIVVLDGVAQAECAGHVGVQCLLQRSGRCNLEAGKRCSHFARVVLPKHPELRAAYDALPARGPGDTPEAVSGPRKPWPVFDAPAPHVTVDEPKVRRPRGRPEGSRDSYRRERKPAKPMLGTEERPRPERYCACGAVLEPGRRKCDRCTLRARRERDRRRQARRRARGKQVTAV